MFLGHIAVGLASKRMIPRAPLWVLIMAPLFLDVLWPVFLVLGIETVRIDPGNTVVTPLDLHDYPYTHSLVGAVVWSALFAGVFFALRRDSRAAVVLAFAVFSHWILDVITHRPDMPLYPGSAVNLGMGLWNSLAGTLVVELGMFAASIYVYTRCTRAKDRTGRVALASFVAFLLLAYVGSVFGPPPPSVQAIEAMGIAMWLLFAWAAWIERHRETV